MKITMQTVYAGLDPRVEEPRALCLAPGDVVDFPAAVAEELIAGRYAEAVIVPVAASHAAKEVKRGPARRNAGG